MARTDPKVTWRIPPDLLARLQAEHARTYGSHRLSFNAWIIERLRSLFPAKRRR